MDKPTLRHAGTATTLPTIGDDALYYHRNQQYSIVALTNAAGTLVERYTYSAYGTLGIYDPAGTVRSSSPYANRYTYTGREWDADLNLYHFRARWYDPATGGFISRDPLGYVDGMSLYRGYFGMAMLDPSGNLRNPSDDGSNGNVQYDLLARYWIGASFWTITKALEYTNHHRDVMKADGNLFGYNLHTAWMQRDGSYTPTPDDIEQVRRETTTETIAELTKNLASYLGVVSSFKTCPKMIPIDIDKRQVNFNPFTNINMFFAYGGARLSISGNCMLVSNCDWTLFTKSCCYYICSSLQIRWDDKYAFKAGELRWWRFDSRRKNGYYDAALYLEDKGIGLPFDHALTYRKTFAYDHCF